MLDVKYSVYFSFLNAYMNGINEVRKSYDSVMAFDFNSLDFFSIGENKTSEILAYFLNPHSNHGQGYLFLELFLKTFNLNEVWEKINNLNIDVECEMSTDQQRRIDIVIRAGNNDFLIGIENKIYLKTQDQKLQLEHYNDFLKESAVENYILIYLTPSGKDVSEYTMNDNLKSELVAVNKFHHISYEEHIIPLVREWHVRCQAIRVKSFLQDFEQFLKNQYTGEKFMDQKEILIKHALERENAEVTLSLIKNAEDIYSSLLNQLKQQIQIYADEHQYKLEWKITRKDKWANFKLFVPDLTKQGLVITFEFENKFTQDLYFGYVYSNSIEKIKPEVQGKLRDKFFNEFNSKEGPSDGWPCWAFFEYRNWHQDAYLLISKGEMISKIVSKIEQLIKIATSL